MRSFAILLAALTLAWPVTAAADEPAAAEAEEFEIFAPPIDWYDSAPRGQVIQVVSHVRLLLKEDWASKSTTVDKVVPRYVAANALCPDDGRLPFAWGLFFWKSGDRVKARSAFAKSVVISPRFLAGHQAVAWANFELGEPDRGLESLEGLVIALQEPAAEYPSKNQQLRAAEWMGQAAGYLQGSALTPPQVARLTELNRKLGELPEELRIASARGRQISLDRAAELKSILALPPDGLQASFVEQLAKTQEKLTICEKRIGELSQEKQGNSAEVRAAQQEHAQGLLAMRQLTQQVNSHVSKANSLTRSSYGEVVEERVEEYEREKQDDGSYKKVFKGKYKTVERKLPETPAETAQRLGDIQEHRAAAVNKAQAKVALQAQLKAHLNAKNALTGEAAKFQNTVAGEWDALHAEQRRLKQQQARTESWQLDPKKFAAYVRTVDPYVPWDVEVLRDQLLDSMTLTDPEPARPAPEARSP